MEDILFKMISTITVVAFILGILLIMKIINDKEP